MGSFSFCEFIHDVIQWSDKLNLKNIVPDYKMNLIWAYGQEGEMIKLIAQTKKKMQRGDTQEKIADDLMEEESLINPIYQLVKENPDKTEEEIYEMLDL